MTEQDCRTKAELMEEIEKLSQINDDLRAEKAEVLKDKNYWFDAWREEREKNVVYTKRLKNLQHATELLAGMVGEVDITALTKEEKA